MLYKNNTGFGLAGIVIVLLAVSLIGAAGWMVYSRNSDKDPQETTQHTQHIKTTDSANTFSFSYPDTWQLKPYVWESCCEGPEKTEPDWTVETKPITLYPSANDKVTITINKVAYGVQWDSYDALKASVKEDFFASILFDGQREDGHQALFSRVDYLGPPDAKVESFTDHRYYFDTGEAYVRVDFREKYHHDWPDDETGPDIDNSQYLADFEHIAQSIKFRQ